MMMDPCMSPMTVLGRRLVMFLTDVKAGTTLSRVSNLGDQRLQEDLSWS